MAIEGSLRMLAPSGDIAFVKGAPLGEMRQLRRRSSPASVVEALPETSPSSQGERFRMIIFDKDGTLGNDRDSLRRWADYMTCQTRSVLETSVPRATASEVDQCISDIHQAIGWDEQRQALLPSALLAAGTWEEILVEFTNHLSTALGTHINPDLVHERVSFWHAEIGALHSNDAPILDDLSALLETCRSYGLIVAVCTSDDRRSTNAALAHWNIDALVDHSLCGDEVTHGKPSAHPLLQLCKRAGVERHECIVVGDTTADTGMARNAGAGLCIGVLSGSGEREQLLQTGADWILSDVGELPSFFERLRSE